MRPHQPDSSHECPISRSFACTPLEHGVAQCVSLRDLDGSGRSRGAGRGRRLQYAPPAMLQNAHMGSEISALHHGYLSRCWLISLLAWSTPYHKLARSALPAADSPIVANPSRTEILPPSADLPAWST